MNKSLSLYEITSQMLSLLESEGSTPEAIEAAFGDIVAKDNRICHFIRDIEASADAHKQEEKRLSERRRVLENKAKQLKQYIMDSMQRLEIDTIEAGTFKVTVQQNPPALEEVDQDKTPPEYRIVIPASCVPDKDRIKTDLKNGSEVPGWKLTRGKSLRIK